MRIRNWAGEMNSVIAKNKHREYELGTWDCAIFSNAIIEATTGSTTEHLDVVSGKYRTEIGFLRALKKQGFYNLRDYIVHCLGEPIGRSSAWRGDLAFYQGCLGVNVGPYAMFIGSDSLHEQPMQGSNLVAIDCALVDEFFKVR